ncbi:hypothetical protein KKF91_02985 [Myxococcota bacterium]|nr:hypothetical protein [Myxococcota bacterium]MBU1429505.1 hypothetical protein [Myxococcota bacterium]MBU1896186.1 hypothetical protein [Myxococcota bacterium]
MEVESSQIATTIMALVTLVAATLLGVLMFGVLTLLLATLGTVASDSAEQISAKQPDVGYSTVHAMASPPAPLPDAQPRRDAGRSRRRP